MELKRETQRPGKKRRRKRRGLTFPAIFRDDPGQKAALAGIGVLFYVLMILFAYYVTFRLTGGDYQAAVITAGHTGFGLGATPNAIANMEAVCAKYGIAPDAFFAVAAVGAFFIDIVNVIVINVLIKIFA